MSVQEPRNAGELADRFGTLDPAYGPVPIWWWSGGRLDRERLRWQMSQLVEGGVQQAVVMCLAPRGPLYGSLADDPPFLSEPWWELFVAACEDAHELGFKFWLYDQYGFSGANFQGQLVASHPAWAGQELGRVSLELAGDDPVRVSPPAGSTALAAYALAPDGSSIVVPLDDDGSATSSGTGRLVLCYAQTRGFDYYDEAACEALIDTVLGEFRRRADKWFGPVITGLFQDELPHLPTWGKEFAETFAAARGYDLVERIACLWEGEGDAAAAAVRQDYHAHRAELARKAFFEPYGAWAAGAGLVAGFDQQTPAREGDPAGSTDLYGDYLRTMPSSAHPEATTGAIPRCTARWLTRPASRAPGWRHSTPPAGAAPSRRPTTGWARSCVAAPTSTTPTRCTTPRRAAGGSGHPRRRAGGSPTGRTTGCSPTRSRGSAR
jgi:hypothetical protein